MVKDPVDSTSLAIGAAVRSARSDAGLSTRALATKCEISQALVSQIERGVTAPSLATLYRIAKALEVSPSSLLPAPDVDDVLVVSSTEGNFVASGDKPTSAIGRVVLADRRRDLEIYEYRAGPADDLDIWFEHPGDKVLFLLEGALRVDFKGRPSRQLRAGDCLVHSGEVPHRWQVEGTLPIHLLLVITRHHDTKPTEPALGDDS